MKLVSIIVMTILMSIILAIIISKLLNGKIKKYTREELEEKQFGKK
jgi:ABC-type polysaccharide transport system permease subunit